jgi:hypothetical protein
MTGGLVGGLLLALVSAAAINLGFLLQHRGLRGRPGAHERRPPLWRVLRSPYWLGGQALGWAGFAAQIVAVSIAPLSLVQSFAAGGLALSVPLAAGLFGHTITRRELGAVMLTAAGLAVLPIALPAGADRLNTEALLATIAAALILASPAALSRSAPLLAIAAGLSYGVADAAIKAISLSGNVVSGWTALAAAATFGGFLAFQSALRKGSAIAAISLMNALAALVALACGLIAFGESLGTGPAAIALHALAIALVLACVPVLASAQAELGEAAESERPKSERPKSERPREHATGGEQESLEPWPHTRMAAPHHVAQPHVAGQRERGL